MRNSRRCLAAGRQLYVIWLATWRSGYAAACKAVYLGSIPGVASNIFQTLDQKHAGCGHCPAGQSYLDGDSDIL